ncbi:MAG: hypothetical protein JEZ05_08250 [Tenericutes bacterium]|nr:hypothetical protein [Mycoplasmatota bacterium]
MFKKISVLLFAALMVISFTTTTVYAASDIDGPSVIHKEANQVFTIGNLLSLYDMDVFPDYDGYTGYGNVPGEYLITITQGSATKDVTIVVVENWGLLEESNDVLYVTDEKDIYVSSDRILTLYEIIFYIYSTTGYVNTEYNFRYEEIKNEYHYVTLSEEGLIPEGSYELTFRLTYYSGEQGTYSALIQAVELQELPGMILEPPASSSEKFMKALPWMIGVGAVIYLLKHRKKKGSYI